MKKIILTTASFITLMSTMPAMAETVIAQTQSSPESSTTGNIVEDAKTAVKNIKKDTAEAYENIKATLIGKEASDKNIPIVIDSRKTANGIIGHHVYNGKNESVGKVTDIILSKDGKATMIIISDDMFGMGKKVAFDYSAITRVESDGDVIMPLTEESLKNAASFSYTKANSGEDQMRVIPDNAYSVDSLLRGRLLNQNKEPVADIENITFKNGTANWIVVGFDKTLGFGGERAVLSYNDAKVIRYGNALDFQLSANKNNQFEIYKKTLTK